MSNEPFSILTKIEQPPYGLKQIDDSWKIFGHSSKFKSVPSCLEKLIEACNKKKISKQDEIESHKLNSIDVANYINKYHPKLKFIDVSAAREFILFTQIQAQDINHAHWKGGKAGSVQLILEDAKERVIAEVLERTFLATTDKIIWASAVATGFKQAELYAKIEAIERWIIMKWWKKDIDFAITNDFIPTLPANVKQLFDAVLFEWEHYNAKVQCVKILNPFDLEIALATVDVFLGGRHWTFYGNGLERNLKKAAEKACLETLQFIPGPNASIFLSLKNSLDENDQRILSWSNQSRKNCFIKFFDFVPEYFMDIQESETFYEKINQVFNSLNLKSETLELKECSNVFVSYVESSINWRREKAVPIV